MKKLLIKLICVFAVITNVFAQEGDSTSTESPLEFSGSVDTYYKYDFSGQPNIGTSFANDHNSFSLGMFNLIASKTVGKASFVADVAFGSRNASSVGPSDYEAEPSIQNLYVEYAFSDKFSMTAGYMGTFVGYEVISPTGNFNYSTSYLFTNGPFQNAGVRFSYAFSDKVTLMAGVFNDWNVYNQPAGVDVTSVGGQLAITPVENWDVYLNFISGDSNGKEFDITTGYQISDAFYLGLNAAMWSYEDAGIISKFTGAALYAQYAVSDAVVLGVRGESFSTENTGYIGYGLTSGLEAEKVTSLTFSANIGSGSLKFIPEIRFDSASDDVFLNSDIAPSKSAAQGVLAAVFSF